MDMRAAERVLKAVKARQLPRAAMRVVAEQVGEGVNPKHMGLAAIPTSKFTAHNTAQAVEQLKAYEGFLDPSGLDEIRRKIRSVGIEHSQLGRISGGRGAIVQSTSAHDLARAGARMLGNAPPPAMTGPQHKMLEAVLKGHELAEVRAPVGHTSMRSAGHMSPEVILQEHNMITTLPPEFAPVKETMQAFRRGGVEDLLLARQGITYGEGQRLSRHARKRITQAMEKRADVITELKPHQQRVRDRIAAQPGLVVAHGLGSGKTLSSLAAAEALGGKAKIVVPAALVSNYRKEIAKHVVDPKAEYKLDTLQREAIRGKDDVDDPVNLLVVDEAHRLRDPGSKTQAAIKRQDAQKRMLLTGSAMYNRPFDLASLVNVAADSPIFPSNQSDFDRQYIGERVVDPGWWARNVRGVRPGVVPVLKNVPALKERLQHWVDYHENSTEGFPNRIEENVEVPFSKDQKKIYDAVMNKAPAWVKYKVHAGLPPSKQESKDLNAFLSAARQVSVTPGGLQEGLTPEQAALMSPKVQKAVERLIEAQKANPDHRAVVYSNFLDAGIAPYEALLQKNQIPYGKFTGEMPKRERDKLVADYNEGKLRALLLSSAGGEGLDLKGTRQIQVLDPHFNKEKIEQVIGRGIRYKSHEHLPEDQRNVKVEKYYSVEDEPGFLKKLVGKKRDGSVDEYLRQLSEDKDRLNQQVRELLRT